MRKKNVAHGPADRAVEGPVGFDETSMDALVRRYRPDPEMVSVRVENRQLKCDLQRLKLDQGEQAELLHEVLAAVKALPANRVAYRKPDERMVSSPVSLVVHATDWHIGAQVDADEVEQFNAFGWGIACSRVMRLAEQVDRWAQMHRHMYNVEELVVLGTGDWISGDIHQELLVTNEFPAPVQAVKAGMLFADFVARLAPSFKSVRVEFVTLDNHGRLTKKPQKAQGGWNNWSFVVGTVAQERLRNQKNVTFKVYPRAHEVVQVQGTRYLIGHGDGIMGTWGIPWYGIERRKQREAMARLNMPEARRFNKIIIGHFHSALNHEHWQIGGSLSGTDANDHKEGRHSRAHQTAWLVHPRHGEFDWLRFYL